MSIDAMKQALEALDEAIMLWREEMEYRSAIDAADPWEKAANTLRLAIQQQEALSALIAESQALGAYDVPKAERQEPVGWVTRYGFELARTTIFSGESIAWRIPVYTAPPQRLPDYVWCGCGDGIMPNTGAKCGTCASIDAAPPQRQPLTDEEAWRIFEEARNGSVKPVGVLRGIRAIERAHGIGGGE